MPIFVSVENEDGQTTYEAFDPAKHGSEITALPAEAVAAHPDYQRVAKLKEDAVKESKQRLQRAQTAETRLQSFLKPEGDEQDEENPEPPQTKPNKQAPVTPLSREEIIRIMDEENQARSTATQTRRQELEGLMTKHKLANVPDALAILEGAADPAKTAAVLGRSANRFDEIAGGNPDNNDIDLVGINNVRQRMGLRPKTVN